MHRGEWLQHVVRTWVEFWFFRPSYTVLALMRIGVGAVVVYVFLVHSLDLEAHYSISGWAGEEQLAFLDRMAWAFSPLHWLQSRAWLYGVHSVAIISAVAFLLGVFPSLSGLLTLIFNLSYSHGNPVVVLSLDTLINMALIYLVVSPCGRGLSMIDLVGLFRHQKPHARSVPSEWSRLGGLAMRLLQIHLCILYFQSGVRLLSEDWLSGALLSMPRMIELRAMLEGGEMLATGGNLGMFAYAVALFHLYFGLLVWLPLFRYPVLLTSVVVHLVLGFGWQLLPFNLLMLVLNLAFVRPYHVEWTLMGLGALLGFRWQPPVD